MAVRMGNWKAIRPRLSAKLEIYDLGKGSWNVPALRSLLEGILPEQKRVEKFKIDIPVDRENSRPFWVSASILQQESRGTQLILLALESAKT